MKKYTYILSILIFTQFLSGMQGNHRNGKIIASWHLNENAGAVVYDSTGRGHTSTVFSGCAWVSGKYESGLYLDGNDYISFADSADFDIQTGEGFTATAWAKWTNDNQDAGFIAHSQDGTNGWWTLGLIGGGGVIFIMRNNASGQTNLGGITGFNDGKWHFICGVRENDGTTLKLYVDGKLKANGVLSGSVLPNQIAGIGRHYAGTADYYLTGYVDEVALYSYGFNAGEVNSKFRAGRKKKQ